MTVAGQQVRLEVIESIILTERAIGTYGAVKKYNIFFGQSPGNNIWAKLYNGQVCDLAWMFDLAIVGMPIGNGPDVAVLKMALPGVGHAYHGIRQLAGVSANGLAYSFGRFMGGAITAASEGRWAPLGSYLKGALNEDNANGLRAANMLVMGATIESLIHPSELKAAGL